MALICAVLVVSASAAAGEASLTVDLARPGIETSPTLFGIFFEEINHAGDGGIYAELVRNRSFEDAAAAPDGWSLVKAVDGEGSIAVDGERPLHPRSPRSLRLTIGRIGGGTVGVANAGYWGIAVREGKRYSLALHARAGEDFKGALVARLESAGGSVLAEGRIEGLGRDWKRFACELAAKASDATARLVIAATAPGTVWLDVVSLFPKDTWKDRPNGLRADLAGMLADLRPAFVRFPGGCFVEGDILANAFRWKDTIGEIAERPGHWNLWGYRSTDGLGYHEYLQMCEDLGAEPMFVINCGMSHRGNVPMEALGPWVQDALDAIEYANGPATTRWGEIRAAAGHPAPFGLKYLEIGNENGGPAYEERYARFHDAVKARYPEIRLIADVPVSTRPMDILDEHYYSSPEWFLANANKYDRYDRKGPKIYVGEYAVTANCGKGNLRAAIAEAAFMTGLERNSDIVIMASYAPLFVNANDRKWNPDAICFDSAACYGTPSYHVQKLFREHQADVILPCRLACESPPIDARGAIGLGTWSTRAEYKEVRVKREGRTLFSADFAATEPPWRVVRGDWKVRDGVYRQESLATDVRAVAGDPAWTDLTYTVKARKITGAEGFLILFRVRDDANWIWWNIGGWGNVRHAIEKCVGGSKTILGDSVPGKVETGRWYDIAIEIKGARIRCLLDGKVIHDVEDRAPIPLAAVAGLRKATGEIILKVVNAFAAEQPADVRIEGATRIRTEGVAIVLTSASPDDENTFAEPRKVAPVSRRIDGLGSTFRHTLPSWSLTILRLRSER